MLLHLLQPGSICTHPHLPNLLETGNNASAPAGCPECSPEGEHDGWETSAPLKVYQGEGCDLANVQGGDAWEWGDYATPQNHTAPHHTTPHHGTPRHTTPHHTMTRHTIPHHTMTRQAASGRYRPDHGSHYTTPRRRLLQLSSKMYDRYIKDDAPASTLVVVCCMAGWLPQVELRQIGLYWGRHAGMRNSGSRGK